MTVAPPPRRIGIVAHPVRDLDGPLSALRGWAGRHDVALVEVAVPWPARGLAPAAVAADCDLVVAIGGDGTMLTAARVAMAADRPALGIGCGSLGVLARVAVDEVGEALDRFAAGDWTAESLPGIAVIRDTGVPELVALNDLSVVRAGAGQIRVSIRVDGVLYARIAGDGVVVSGALGSSAYTIGSGGPLLTPDVEALVVTPLPTHGGTVPPLVVGPRARLALEVDGGYGGVRLELDGQIIGAAAGVLEITRRDAVLRLVALPGQAPVLTVLRDRGIVRDSPRILADGRRSTAAPQI